MTQVCCPGCRLRFSGAVAAYLVACPECGEPPEQVTSAARVLGFRLVSDAYGKDTLPIALTAALAIPTPSEDSP
jgi:hypothetical protein